MLLPVPLLLGLLGLAAAEPAIYFKEQFLDGGKAWSRLEAVPTTKAAPQPRSALYPCNYCLEDQYGGLRGRQPQASLPSMSLGSVEGAASSRGGVRIRWRSP